MVVTSKRVDLDLQDSSTYPSPSILLASESIDIFQEFWALKDKVPKPSKFPNKI